MDMALDRETALAGEVGLAGEIRPVSRLDQRIQEAQKLGFKRIIVPFGQQFAPAKGIKVITVKKVADAFRLLFSQNHETETNSTGTRS